MRLLVRQATPRRRAEGRRTYIAARVGGRVGFGITADYAWATPSRRFEPLVTASRADCHYATGPREVHDRERSDITPPLHLYHLAATTGPTAKTGATASHVKSPRPWRRPPTRSSATWPPLPLPGDLIRFALMAGEAVTDQVA